MAPVATLPPRTGPSNATFHDPIFNLSGGDQAGKMWLRAVQDSAP